MPRLPPPRALPALNGTFLSRARPKFDGWRLCGGKRHGRRVAPIGGRLAVPARGVSIALKKIRGAAPKRREGAHARIRGRCGQAGAEPQPGIAGPYSTARPGGPTGMGWTPYRGSGCPPCRGGGGGGGGTRTPYRGVTSRPPATAAISESVKVGRAAEPLAMVAHRSRKSRLLSGLMRFTPIVRRFSAGCTSPRRCRRDRTDGNRRPRTGPSGRRPGIAAPPRRRAGGTA